MSAPVRLFDPAADSLADLAVLHAASFDAPWNEAALAALLDTPGTFAFHSRDGFVLARVAGDEAEILTLAVAPAARGQGLGRALMLEAANRSQELGAAALFLEVGVANPAALALYAGLGFANVGARKGYYDGQDAAVLRLPLPAKFA
ncbi:MAG: GNAT family N-acetyltransferase [Alphaproteobacteria bacterium]|nr:GNAT family N-acetyltransferase [Alphaproteobacteria bacterium]